MPSTEELLADLLATSREQLRWQRASALPGVRKTVEEALTTTQQRRAFELCDGTRQSSDIASVVGTSPQNFSDWTRRWRNLGIAHEADARRILHLVSLETLGLPVEIEEDSDRGRARS
jgi:hypothetical protein